MRFGSEITAPVDVEVLIYTPSTRQRFGARPELCEPGEPAEVEVRVELGGLDVTEALPADVLEALRAEALEVLEGW